MVLLSQQIVVQVIFVCNGFLLCICGGQDIAHRVIGINRTVPVVSGNRGDIAGYVILILCRLIQRVTHFSQTPRIIVQVGKFIACIIPFLHKAAHGIVFILRDKALRVRGFHQTVQSVIFVDCHASVRSFQLRIVSIPVIGKCVHAAHGIRHSRGQISPIVLILPFRTQSIAHNRNVIAAVIFSDCLIIQCILRNPQTIERIVLIRGFTAQRIDKGQQIAVCVIAVGGCVSQSVGHGQNTSYLIVGIRCFVAHGVRLRNQISQCVIFINQLAAIGQGQFNRKIQSVVGIGKRTSGVILHGDQVAVCIIGGNRFQPCRVR